MALVFLATVLLKGVLIALFGVERAVRPLHGLRVLFGASRNFGVIAHHPFALRAISNRIESSNVPD